MYRRELLLLIAIFIGMKSYLNEEIYRINTIMGNITEGSTKKVNLPIKISGSYRVPDIAPNKGDALHSFNIRLSDKFGGYMLTGNPPSKWSPYITFNQGKSINQMLEEIWRQGINPDVTKLKIQVDSRNYSVKWEATIDVSKDGNAYVGMSTVGSAGNRADERAEGQISGIKSRIPGAKDYTLVLDFKNKSGLYIRQFFYKWTMPGKFKPHKDGNKKTINIDTSSPIKQDKSIEPKTEPITKKETDKFDINKVIKSMDDDFANFNDINPSDYIDVNSNNDYSFLQKILNFSKS